ncbi:MAG: YidB family protein [Pararhizobium sp.]
MTALLSVLAVAGFQNRDKIAEVLRGLAANAQRPADPNGISTTEPSASTQPGGLDGLFGGLGDLLGGSSSGGSILSGGLGGILDQFSRNGHVDKVESWVHEGPNTEIDDRSLSEALGPEVLQDIASRTGLSQEEILSRLSRDLPRAVDGLTPDGRLPEEELHDTATARLPSVPSVKPTIV